MPSAVAKFQNCGGFHFKYWLMTSCYKLKFINADNLSTLLIMTISDQSNWFTRSYVRD